MNKAISVHTWFRNQRRNTFFKDLRFSITCFYTSALIFLSNWLGQKAVSDEYAEEYIDDTEANVGKPGIAEAVMSKFKWITGRSGAWWLVHKAAIAQRLREAGYSGEVIFRDGNGTWEEVSEALFLDSPVIIGTKGLPGIPAGGGHILNIVDEEDDCWVVKDTWGDATTNYKNTNGENVLYPKEWFRKFTETNGKIRIMYFKEAV